MASSIARTVVALVLVLALGALLNLATGAEPRSASPRPPVPPDERWAEVERLASAGRPRAALGIVEAIGEQAGDEATRIRALVRATELRVALHEPEGAVEAIRGSARPVEPVHRVAFALLYADALVAYHGAHIGHVAQRPRIESTVELPVGRWPLETIRAEADRAFREVWRERGVWEDEPSSVLAGPLGLIEPGDHPPGIRDTLRDTVVYLWADLLADTSFWTPEEANGVHPLDVGRLARHSRGETDPRRAADEADAHPLARMVELLAGHEAWHRRRGEPDSAAAAFEAALVRLDRLRPAFTAPEERETIRAELERRLDALGRERAWWARGTAELADWTHQRGRPGDAAAARDLARDCAEAHPESVGGRRCAAIVDYLEAPDYDLRSMASDGPGERSIRVEHKNLDRLWFRAYAFDLVETVERPRPHEVLHASKEIEAIVAGRTPAVSWSAELAPTPDLRSHATYVTPPFDAPGLYLVVASAREDFAEDANRLQATHLVITDLVVLARKVDRRVEVTALSGSTGEPRPGARLSLYPERISNESRRWDRGRRPVASAVADADGRAVLPIPTGGGLNHLVVGRDGEDSAIARGSMSWYRYREYAGGETEASHTLLYTDRSVYRPGQGVLWKAVAIGGDADAGRLETRAETRLRVVLADPQGDEVAVKEVTTNHFGTASGRFEIPAGRLLGAWTLRVEGPDGLIGWSRVAVEEYERPTFEVTLDPPEETLRLGRGAELGGRVRYYFGLPVVTGRVSWRVTREPDSTWVWPPRPANAPQVVANGHGELDAGGRFRVRFTPEADPRDDRSERSEGPGVNGTFYRYRLSVDVTDEGGETRSAERAYPIGFVAVRARIEPGSDRERGERGFFAAGEPVELAVTRTDLDGEPRPGRGSWRLVALVPPEPGRALLPAERPAFDPGGPADGAWVTEGDRLSPRWADAPSLREALAGWREGDEVAAGSLEHGDDGRALVSLVSWSAPAPSGGPGGGAYRFLYSTEDRFGRRFETGYDLVVAGDGKEAPPLAALLLAERSSVPVGGVARLLVHSGLPGQEMVLELFRGDEVIEWRRLSSDGGATVVEIPVLPAHRGGFGAVLTAIRDHQLLRQSVTVDVPWDDRRLAVEVSTFRDRLRPGSREEWRVRVSAAATESGAAIESGAATESGAALETGAAEVLASMYDRSLDLFAPHVRPDVLGLYPSRTAVPPGHSSLEPRYLAWSHYQGWNRRLAYPLLRPDRIELLGDYGIGGPGRRNLSTARDPWTIVTGTPGILSDRIPGATFIPWHDTRQNAFAIDGVVVTDMAAIGSSPTYYDFDHFTELPPAPPPPPPGPSGVGRVSVPLRTRFAETAFFEPHLRLDEDGGASFAFTVPDSVTEWRFWAQAITRDVRAGSVERTTRSVKELQVRPYLPRFLREGDRAEIRVVIDNSGAEAADGHLTVELFAPETGESLAGRFGLDPAATRDVPFAVPPGDSLALTFPVTVPSGAATRLAADGGVAFRATVRAGGLGDGEQRPLPILPSRVRLSQSRTATLDGAETEVLRFDELARDPAASADPTRESERLVVTLDGQLFYGVLGALPYLVEFPYECTEQTLNRFVSTAVVTSVFDRYPEVAAIAEDLAARETRTPAWEEDDPKDPQRALALVETPWLAEGRGGSLAGAEGSERLLRILDPEVARAQREAAIARLRESLTPEGGYPWFPGGPPSPYMTLYLLQGFSRAIEAGAEVPEDLRRPAWEYLHQSWKSGWRTHRCCPETSTFLAYVLSGEPARGPAEVFTPEDRRQLLDHALYGGGGWLDLAPRLKLQLALALHRDLDGSGRRDDARTVLESVMDSAVTTEEEGTFWAPEEHSWLWYRDTVETHAFALSTLNEIAPGDPRRRGLAQWLFLDKQLGHWKSTRATAEAIYALVGYLESEGELGVREEVEVTAGPMRESFVFEPDEYTGAGRRVVVPGDEVTPAMGEVTVSKETPGFLFATATWWFSTDDPAIAGDGDLFGVERRFFLRVPDGDGHVLRPLADGTRIEVGDPVEVHLTLRARHEAEYVHLRDPRGAGFEPETLRSGYRWDGAPDPIGRYEEVRDSGTNFFFECLPAGEYTLRYRLRANLAGSFRVAPATLQSMYAPEHTAYSAGTVIEIRGESGDETGR
jgi:alpha-2-macroglobulin